MNDKNLGHLKLSSHKVTVTISKKRTSSVQNNSEEKTLDLEESNNSIKTDVKKFALRKK